MADGDFEDEDVLLGQGQESPADRWLTDEEYASGKWYRFALERLLPMAQSTRLTTAQLEFVARAGWICYVPRTVWVPRFVETNEFVKDEEKIWPLFNEDGSPVVIRGRIAFMQGVDQIPRFVAEPNSGKDWWGRKFISEVLKLGRKGGSPSDELKKLYFNNGNLGEKRYLKESERVKVRYWIPTPILGESFVQAPRLPFDMIPKDDLNEAFAAEIDRKDTHPDEFVDYQYCGCPGLDEELIRAFRTSSAPRVKKLSQELQDLISSGAVLWRRKTDGKFEVARQVENEAGITMRVHRRVSENYVTARQVFEGLERLKRRYFDPSVADELRYKPVPTNFPVIDGITLGDFSGLDALEVEKIVRWFLVKLAKTDPIAAAKVQRRIRKDFEDWLEVHYDRTLPNEQLRYREWFYDLQAISGNDWASQADRWHYQMQLRIHFKKEPGMISSTSQRANFLEMDLQVADFESWRNLEHMQEHWKFSKAFHNTLASFDPDKTAPKNMRQRDWGGIWNPTKLANDWRFSLLDALAPKTQPELRMQFLAPAWFDKEPWQMMDHDGSLIDRFGQKKVGWVESMRQIKGLSSMAGAAAFPRRTQGKLDQTLSEFRNYPNEYQLLLNDEYFARDPVDVMENQKGIVIFSAMDDVNIRLRGRYVKHRHIVRLNYDNCCRGSEFVEMMWKAQPATPIINMVEGTMKRWKRENKEHFRPLIDRMLEGLYINRELRATLERWYEESDERVWDFVYWHEEMMSTVEGGPSAAGGWELKKSLTVNHEGFGLGYGTLGNQQRRQEVMLAIGLYNGYWTVIKGILEWWSVRQGSQSIMNDRTWIDINDLKMKVAGLLESRKLIWIVARDVLWPLLKIRKLIGGHEPFPFREDSVEALDWAMVREILNARGGAIAIPTIEEINQAEEDGMPELAEALTELRDELIDKNEYRFSRIRLGKFFEINK